MQVLGPIKSMGGSEGVGERDFGRKVRSGLGSQTVECDGDGALYAHVLGSCDQVAYSASICLDQLGRVTQLLGCADGGGSQ